MYTHINEVKLDKLDTIQSYKKLKSVMKHQHGVDLGNPTPDANYRVHHDAKFTDKKNKGKTVKDENGRPLKTIHPGATSDDMRGKRAQNQLGDMVKANRVNKTPEGKAKRKEEAKANLAKKKERRAEPFGRKADGTTTRKRTYESFMLQLENE